MIPCSTCHTTCLLKIHSQTASWRACMEAIDPQNHQHVAKLCNTSFSGLLIDPYLLLSIPRILSQQPSVLLKCYYRLQYHLQQPSTVYKGLHDEKDEKKNRSMAYGASDGGIILKGGEMKSMVMGSRTVRYVNWPKNALEERGH